MFFKKTKISIDTYAISDEGKRVRPLVLGQNIEFYFDEGMKGSIVGMKLTSDNFINAPNHTIYIKNEQLKKILKFLIESEK